MQSVFGLIYHFGMANEPAVDKVIISFQIDAALKQRLRREAKDRKMLMSEYITFVLSESVKHTALTSEDYEEVKKIVKRNEARRLARRAGH